MPLKRSFQQDNKNFLSLQDDSIFIVNLTAYDWANAKVGIKYSQVRDVHLFLQSKPRVTFFKASKMNKNETKLH